MLLARVCIALVFQSPKSGDDPETSFRGLDDGIDVAFLGRDEGIGKALSKFLDLVLPQAFAIRLGSFIQFSLVDDVHRAFRPHHRNFRRWPGKISVRANMFAGHHAIRPTVSLSGDHRDLGHRGLRECEEKFRTVFDDAAELLLRSWQKSWNIFKSYERDIEGVAETHEARAFERGIDIEYAGEKSRLIGDNANRAAVESRESHDDIFREVLVHFEKVSFIDDGVNSVFDVIGFLRFIGYKGVQGFFSPVRRIRCRPSRD